MQLHSEVVKAPGGAPSRSVIFLHGILGQGSNLRTLARRFVEAQPAAQAVLMDLRGHGKSGGAEGVDSLEACADDVVQTCAGLDVRAVVGHSFGGKVAMLLARRLPSLSAVVMLDSAPGTRLDFRGSELTMQVLGVLESATAPFPTRDAFQLHLIDRGLTKDLAQWLAMSLVREADGYRFGPSVARIRALLGDYFATDCWPLLETLAHQGAPRLHFVVGGRSTVFDAEELRHARTLPGATVDVLEGAGHWVHVDDLEGTVRAVIDRLARLPLT